ncbi:DUF1840 domain-containing protein [Photobacterium sp. WH77]|uniref:DUF1840 domain-containing protein n=1 Tax=Photobacterium arenosum TaxID=2774143 RepID=A0ABR9BFX7_9GAMM|nr:MULTISPECIES: DUF1840 domain-containing protein [Photobacterium]MBD8511465.1 DUF1840 domain-containing protein [Photobacterium arenosum]MBV7263905.1 DUF1840 domain-containing protein [Photobacterium sp. WH24]MCG2837599.1 DUF1840 domain-containing protein [Photobacterium sp. WH77]MCG2845215.1 DUF1840 domain-containing protein [Photobacterium sp. WH80]MDO6583270.1 DUF1840 domain-containing protein [Photobacterium sp. 2_MG-2023]
MLITFHSQASANITMFGDVAKQLIHMMGYCENIPGIIDVDDVPQALSNLQSKLAEAEKQEAVQQAETEAEEDPWEDQEPQISMMTRARPLIEMLESAIADEVVVMWESDN